MISLVSHYIFMKYHSNVKFRRTAGCIVEIAGHTSDQLYWSSQPSYISNLYTSAYHRSTRLLKEYIQESRIKNDEQSTTFSTARCRGWKFLQANHQHHLDTTISVKKAILLPQLSISSYTYNHRIITTITASPSKHPTTNYHQKLIHNVAHRDPPKRAPKTPPQAPHLPRRARQALRHSPRRAPQPGGRRAV